MKKPKRNCKVLVLHVGGAHLDSGQGTNYLDKIFRIWLSFLKQVTHLYGIVLNVQPTHPDTQLRG